MIQISYFVLPNTIVLANWDGPHATLEYPAISSSTHPSQLPPDKQKCSPDQLSPRYSTNSLHSDAHHGSFLISYYQAFRAARAVGTRPATANPLSSRFLTPLQIRFLSQETRTAIDKAVASAPVVLFMKGTPDTPQCGFSRASIQVLGLQGVDPAKFTAFNVLEDEELRQGRAKLERTI